jgi:aldose 1-epimerase
VKIKEKPFGTLSTGRKAMLYTIDNGSVSFSVTNYGCNITSIMVPNAKGDVDDIVLGYSTLEGYTRNPVFFGCVVGRFANRVANATFAMGEKSYALTKNDGDNCLHGGKPGYHKMVWKADSYNNPREAGVVFRRLSESGEQGFPGNLDLRVSYGLTKKNEIVIRYLAKTDEPTPVNLTNHTYFNLAGHDSGSVLDQQVQLFCDTYVPVDKHAIPSGKILEVSGTPFDFRSPKAIGKDIGSVPGGYDHNWCVNQAGGSPNPVAGVFDPKSGRAMTVHSTQPGVQFYTGNFLAGEIGKDGAKYDKNAGFCLETQHYPDTPNRGEFPSCTLLPGDRYRQETIWNFDF